MPHIRYIEPSGHEKTVEVDVGVSVMRGAILGNVDGIDAECGGCLSCATCHVYIDPAFVDRIPSPSSDEVEMLEAVTAESRPTSRLSCQIIITPDLEGMLVEIPDSQI